MKIITGCLFRLLQAIKQSTGIVCIEKYRTSWKGPLRYVQLSKWDDGRIDIQNSAKQHFCLDVRNKNVYKTDSSPKVPKMNENVMFIDLPNECKVDFISELPIDIIQKILQMLDTKSLITARSVCKKWKVMCEYALKQRGLQHKISYNKHTQEMNPYYKEALWRLLMFNIKKKYGKPFPFT